MSNLFTKIFKSEPKPIQYIDVRKVQVEIHILNDTPKILTFKGHVISLFYGEYAAWQADRVAEEYFEKAKFFEVKSDSGSATYFVNKNQITSWRIISNKEFLVEKK